MAPLTTHPLLQTKIRPPRLKPQLVDRPQLIRRLCEGLPGRLTLLSAPAGYGKTSLLSQFIADFRPGCAGFQNRASDLENLKFAWLSLDPADNSLERFLRYMIAALQKVHPQAGNTALEMLVTPLPPQPSAILATLINDLEACPDPPVVLVLDDIHLIHEKQVFEVLDELIENQPETLHLILAGRADPPLGLAGLRGRGELNEIRAADLRFSADETVAFLNPLMGLSLTPQQITALEARTEGWIAGLQLAALSMRDRHDVDRFIRVFTGSHRYILDYLVDEVLQRQPREIQDFLLRTSILDRFQAELCEAVLKQPARTDAVPGDREEPALPPSAQILSELERANLFLIPLDDTRTWYRYHTLFSDLLRYRLAQVYPGEEASLHRKAAEWFQAAGMMPEAVQHALAAREFQLAGQLVEEVGLEDLNASQVNRFLGWLDLLPAEIFTANPRLHMLYTFGLFSRSQFHLIEPHLAEAERGIRDLPERERTDRAEHWRITLAELTACRAILSSIQGDLQQTIELSNQAIEKLPATFPMRASVLLGLGVAYRLTGDGQRSYAALVEATEFGLATGQVAMSVTAMCNLSDLLMEMGRPDEARDGFQRALRINQEEFSGALPIASLAFGGYAELAYQHNELTVALENILRALELDALWGNADIHIANLSRLVRIQLAQGEFKQARGTLEALREEIRKASLSPHVAGAVLGAELLALDSLGFIDARHTEDFARNLDRAPARTSFMEAQLNMTRAHFWYLLARQDHDGVSIERALNLAEPLAGYFREMGMHAHELEAMLIHAAILSTASRETEASDLLAPALRLAASMDFSRVFLNLGEPMRRLVEDAVRRITAMDRTARFTNQLLAAFTDTHPTGPGQIESTLPAQAGSTDALSAREVEVLRLAEQGLSNTEIAARLTLSPGTVKRHMHNIFEKLGASSRPEAIHKARGLGILA